LKAQEPYVIYFTSFLKIKKLPCSLSGRKILFINAERIGHLPDQATALLHRFNIGFSFGSRFREAFHS